MPTFKQKRDRNHYYEDLMQGYPDKKWYIREDENTPYNLKWDSTALNACADEGFTYEQARNFLEIHSDECAAAYYRELEAGIKSFKECEAHDHATFLLNKIVEVSESTARDFSIFEGDEWPGLLIKVEDESAIIAEWEKENVILRIDFNDVKRHRVSESGNPDDVTLVDGLANISKGYVIDLEILDRALRRFAQFFSNGTAATK